MTDAPQSPSDAAVDEDAPSDGSSRKATAYLIGALALLLIPIVVGFVLANTNSNDTSNSGMDDMGGGGFDVTDSSSDELTVRPFSDIQDGPIVLDLDPSGTAARLEITTRIDVACAVIFGTSSQYGGIATDSDMNGGAHQDHSPILADLEPGTTYVYRLQGSDARGRVYVSENFQFTTPGADGASGPTNLSLDATVVETSSNFSDGFAGANAIDGSLATEWSSRGDGNDAYIVIDLGAAAEITGIGFRTREMSDGTSITNQFTVTVDGQDFGPFDAGIGLSTAQFEATGQTVRVDLVDTTGGNTGAVEIEIYGRMG